MVWRRLGEVRKGRMTIEDKKMAAFEQHGAEFLALIGQKEFPWPRRLQSPPPQLWTQMQTWNVLVGKFSTAIGVLYVRRRGSSGQLECSRLYNSLDGDVTRTTCVILEAETLAEEEAARLASLGAATLYVETWRRLCSWATIAWLYCVLLWKAFCGRRGVYVLGGGQPAFFKVRDDMRLGCGASGVVWRSAGGSQVVKLFRDPEAALHEAEMLQRAQGLAVPTLQGVVEDAGETGVVMSYRGSAIRDFRETTHKQKRQLVQALKSLHERGIHHHDVREENVLLDDDGTVTLVDFDRAEVVDGLCFGCADIIIICTRVAHHAPRRRKFQAYGKLLAALGRLQYERDYCAATVTRCLDMDPFERSHYTP
ncbi:kinase-like domain-containing protein [Mycena pura]|uniref:Kinase-like domain-containing protein n=1 Tax=Mycena pura TaxID=153505 RepID=A0AAD6VHT9_9AGAR|nr:kinase-like domain-containing protein [Mycena pura]